MVIFEVLAEAHRRHRSLLAKVVEAPPDLRAGAFERFCHELEAHVRAMSCTLYEALLRAEAGLAQARARVSALDAVHRQIEALQTSDPSSLDWLPRFRQLEAALERHIEAEERSLVPLARRLLSPANARTLADGYSWCRQERPECATSHT